MKRRFPLFILAVAAATLGWGCDGAIRVRGRVVDDSGRPVSNATIQFERGANYRTFENGVMQDGCFKAGHVVAPGRYQYRVHVAAPGFQSADAAIPTNDDNWAIVLLRRVGDHRTSSIVTAVGRWPAGGASGGCEFERSVTP